MRYAGVKNPSGYTLSDKPLGISGGEGTIYPIVGDQTKLAKLYHGNALSSFASAGNRQEKLLNLIKMPQSDCSVHLAWPQDVLQDASGRICGFVMKKFDNVQELATVVSDSLDWRLRVTIAYNLCDVIREVHEMHQCLGDMQPKNFGVNLHNGNVCAFDVDSFHLRLPNGHVYPCYVGLKEYYPPELQRLIRRGENMRTLDPNNTFSQSTDLFALAVLVFMLLFQGFHPFRAQYVNTNESSSLVTDAAADILHGCSPYFRPTANATINVRSPKLDIVPAGIRDLFQRAFFGAPSARPSAAEWQAQLFSLLGSIRTCAKNHSYLNSLSSCPWCELEERIRRLNAVRPVQTVKAPPKPAPVSSQGPGASGTGRSTSSAGSQPVTRVNGMTAAGSSLNASVKVPDRPKHGFSAWLVFILILVIAGIASNKSDGLDEDARCACMLFGTLAVWAAIYHHRAVKRPDGLKLAAALQPGSATCRCSWPKQAYDQYHLAVDGKWIWSGTALECDVNNLRPQSVVTLAGTFRNTPNNVVYIDKTVIQ